MATLTPTSPSRPAWAWPSSRAWSTRSPSGAAPDGTGTVVEMTWHTGEPPADSDLDSAAYAALAAEIAGSARREA